MVRGRSERAVPVRLAAPSISLQTQRRLNQRRPSAPLLRRVSVVVLESFFSLVKAGVCLHCRVECISTRTLRMYAVCDCVRARAQGSTTARGRATAARASSGAACASATRTSAASSASAPSSATSATSAAPAASSSASPPACRPQVRLDTRRSLALQSALRRL